MTFYVSIFRNMQGVSQFAARKKALHGVAGPSWRIQSGVLTGYTIGRTDGGDADLPVKKTMWVKQCHKPPIWEWFLHVSTTYLWWFGGWFIFVLPTLDTFDPRSKRPIREPVWTWDALQQPKPFANSSPAMSGRPPEEQSVRRERYHRYSSHFYWFHCH